MIRNTIKIGKMLSESEINVWWHIVFKMIQVVTISFIDVRLFLTLPFLLLVAFVIQTIITNIKNRLRDHSTSVIVWNNLNKDWLKVLLYVIKSNLGTYCIDNILFCFCLEINFVFVFTLDLFCFCRTRSQSCTTRRRPELFRSWRSS